MKLLALNLGLLFIYFCKFLIVQDNMFNNSDWSRRGYKLTQENCSIQVEIKQKENATDLVIQECNLHPVPCGSGSPKGSETLYKY